jgi:hypothetical protein
MIGYTSNAQARFAELAAKLEEDEIRRADYFDEAIRIYEGFDDRRQAQRLRDLRDNPPEEDTAWKLAPGVGLGLRLGNAAVLIRLDIDNDGDRRSVPSMISRDDFSLIEELSGGTLVPHGFTKLFSHNWMEASCQLGRFFGAEADRPHDLPDAIAVAQSIRIESDDVLLQALPLELARLEPGDQILCELAVRSVVYRASTREQSEFARVRWLQTALSKLTEQTSLPTDGKFGPGTRGALAEFQTGAGLEADGRVSDETLAAMGGQLRDAAPPPRVLVVAASDADDRTHLRGVSRWGVRWDEIYRQHGCEAEGCSSLDAKYLEVLLQSFRPRVLHICCPLQEDPSLGGVYLDLSGADANTGDRMTGKKLSRLLASASEGSAEPIVILDVPWPSQELEAVRQLFLRNAFGMELFRGCRLGNVLCAGLVVSGKPTLETEERCHDFAKLIRTEDSWKTLVQKTHRAMPAGNFSLLEALPNATALFTHDPTLPLTGSFTR